MTELLIFLCGLVCGIAATVVFFAWLANEPPQNDRPAPWRARYRKW